MVVRKYKDSREKRHRRVRGKVSGTFKRPRLTVFRSGKHIYVQIIDDEKEHTLVSASDLELGSGKAQKGKEGTEGSRVACAREVGKLVARRTIKKGIKRVVFDRGGYKYHGRVKALAEGARKGGLKF